MFTQKMLYSKHVGLSFWIELKCRNVQ